MCSFTGANKNSNLVAKLLLATVLSVVLLICHVQCETVEDLALPGDDKIVWWSKDKFETLEEMFVREKINSGDVEEDNSMARDYFNENLAKVNRGKAIKSDRLAQEMDAFNLIGNIYHPTAEDCNMRPMISAHEQAGSRPLVSKFIRHFGARKIDQCREENNRKFNSLKRSFSNPTVIEKLPADELIRLIPEDSPSVPKANWPTLIGLLFVANDNTPQSSQLLKQQCSYFDDKLENYQYASRLASAIKSIAPEEFTEAMDFPKIEAIFQRERLCLDVKFQF